MDGGRVARHNRFIVIDGGVVFARELLLVDSAINKCPIETTNEPFIYDGAGVQDRRLDRSFVIRGRDEMPPN